MTRWLAVLGLVYCTGCSGLGLGHLTSRPSPAGCANPTVEQVMEGSAGQPGCSPPAAECKRVDEIHVQVPPQKVCVKKCKPAAPEAPPTAAVPTQEVLLVPRTVYVPYAPQVPTGPARMVPLQTTPAQTTRMVPVLQAPVCASNAPSAAALIEAQKQIDQLTQRLQSLEGTLDRLTQTTAALAATPPNQLAPPPPPTLGGNCGPASSR